MDELTKKTIYRYNTYVYKHIEATRFLKKKDFLQVTILK